MKGRHHLTFPLVMMLKDFYSAASKCQVMVLIFQIHAATRALCECMIYKKGLSGRLKGGKKAVFLKNKRCNWARQDCRIPLRQVQDSEDYYSSGKTPTNKWFRKGNEKGQTADFKHQNCSQVFSWKSGALQMWSSSCLKVKEQEKKLHYPKRRLYNCSHFKLESVHYVQLC